MKRIAVVTPGGDAPGMNAAIRAVVREAIYHGFEVYGVNQGYSGLINNHIEPLNPRSVSGIIGRGGTILRTHRCPEMKTKQGMSAAIETLKGHNIEALVVIGGDGSMRGAERISREGIAVIGIPASIDNDIFGTDETIGFDTAIDTAVEAIDKIRDTATSHERVFIVEVMGREHGFLALSAGIASGAEFILVPEVKFNVKGLCKELKEEQARGKNSLIIVFAEGAGNPYNLAEEITKLAAEEVRVSSLGYIQRGGNPSARSRILASRFGSYAVQLLLKNKKNEMIILQGDTVNSITLKKAAAGEKKIDLNLYNIAKRLAT